MIFKIFFEDWHAQEVNKVCKDIMANMTAI